MNVFMATQKAAFAAWQRATAPLGIIYRPNMPMIKPGLPIRFDAGVAALAAAPKRLPGRSLSRLKDAGTKSPQRVVQGLAYQTPRQAVSGLARHILCLEEAPAAYRSRGISVR
ncbi:hypothetical protein [Dyella silvatica]|uniref:hypothetical protein n=1 Tax=Dyella silvatica TaxID=2992128 RepID=UPI0022553A59|nr:hypothetical protein [Dyella silvatica]